MFQNFINFHFVIVFFLNSLLSSFWFFKPRCLTSWIPVAYSNPTIQPGLVCTLLFCYLPNKCKCHEVLELSSVTTITVMAPVSCDQVASFNYDDKEARDVGLTCWCHLSIITPASIFQKNMGWRIICSVCFAFMFFVCFLLLLFLFIYLLSASFTR